MNKKNKATAPVDACVFEDCSKVSFEETGNGKFEIEGYSGKILKHWYWGKMAIDLSGVKFAKKKIPVLESHNSTSRLGFSTKQSITDKITIEGEFLPNLHAQEVRGDMAAGFPMEASLAVVPSVVESIADGTKAQVNGHTLKGPGTIFRKSTVGEVSMCTFGVDNATSSEVLAAKAATGDKFEYNLLGDTVMELTLLQKIATKLGLKDAEPTEELVLSAVDDALETKPEVAKPEVVLEADDPLVKLVCDNRATKLAGLVKAGVIIPAVNEMLTKKFVEPGAVALSIKDKVDDGFDLMCEVLLQNRPVKLEEATGAQSLELTNESAVPPNVMEKTVLARRKAAGYKD